MSQAPSEAELVGRIASGGAAARAAEALLCERFAPRVRLYGLRHLRDEERARDLVQVVLLGLIEAARAGRIAEPDKVARYVLATARHAAQRLREGDLKAQPTAPDELARSLVTPPLDALAVDRTALMRCVAGLEERGRVVVHLTFTAEHSAEEIARALGTTAGNVRVLRHRALAALRSCLDGPGAGGAA